MMPRKLAWRAAGAAMGMIAAAALACNLVPQPTPSSDALATAVAATLTASRPQVAATPLPTVALGSVSGAICYPSEGIPAMQLYFQNTDSGTVSSLAIAPDQGDYQTDLLPGTYVAYAWLPDGGLGGSYSQAVPCGLSAACTDHNLLPFAVQPGQLTSGVDICDWYGGPGSVPTPPGGLPGVSATPSSTPPPGGTSLNCDGTYQRVRIIDGGAAGKSVVVDDWGGAAWAAIWTFAGGDPMIRQIEAEAAAYTFGGCQQLVIVPMRYTGSGAVLELVVFRWNGSGMDEVYSHTGTHGEWRQAGDSIIFEESLYLFGEPTCCPCNRQTLEHRWNGTQFVQVDAVTTPTGLCTPPP